MDDDGESELVFDFEADSGIDAGGASSSVVASDAPAPPHGHDQRNFRRTVCRYWLKGLCILGDSCNFLHQLDQNRMPLCRFKTSCRDANCIFKHPETKECDMYNMGFCPNGPHCRDKHIKKPGPPPPVEEVLRRQLQQRNHFNHGSSNILSQHGGNNYNQQWENSAAQLGSVLNSQNLPASVAPVVQQPAVQQVHTVNPQHVPQPQQQNAQVQGAPSGSSNQATRTANPFPQGKSRYILFKSCNQENLEISVQQDVWTFQRANEFKLKKLLNPWAVTF